MRNELKKMVVEKTIKEDFPDKMYSGKVKTKGGELDYVVIFDINLNKAGKIPFIKDLRRLVTIELSRNGHQLELSDDEYLTFFGILVVSILEHQQSGSFFKVNQESSDYMTEGCSRDEDKILKEVVICKLSEVSIKLLTSERFGCRF